MPLKTAVTLVYLFTGAGLRRTGRAAACEEAKDEALPDPSRGGNRAQFRCSGRRPVAYPGGWQKRGLFPTALSQVPWSGRFRLPTYSPLPWISRVRFACRGKRRRGWMWKDFCGWLPPSECRIAWRLWAMSLISGGWPAGFSVAMKRFPSEKATLSPWTWTLRKTMHRPASGGQSIGER